MAETRLAGPRRSQRAVSHFTRYVRRTAPNPERV